MPSHPATDVVGRFDQLVRYAKILRSLANRAPDDHALLNAAGRAEDRAVDHSTECLAQEVFKRPADSRGVIDVNSDLVQDLQDRFDAMHDILDRHVPPGPAWSGLRRVLLDRAVPYASFSSHAAEQDWTDDYEGLANELNNEHEAESLSDGENEGERIDAGHGKQMNAIHESRLSRHVLDRELGLRPRVPYDALPPYERFDDDEPKPTTEAPAAGAPETLILSGADKAERMIEELGHLRQVLREKVSTIDYVFADERDRVPWDIDRQKDQARELRRQLSPGIKRLNSERRAGRSAPVQAVTAPHGGHKFEGGASSSDESAFDPPARPLQPGRETTKRAREDDSSGDEPVAKRTRAQRARVREPEGR